MDDISGMKPPPAVQYPLSLIASPTDLARASARFAPATYGMSLALAGLTLAGSICYQEITRTFGAHVFGLRAATLWEGVFVVVALAWFAATLLGLMCLPQRGRPRTFGALSVGMNLAAAVLTAATMA